jgi:hypothetical protein
MYCRCDRLWGELTPQSVIFQSVFFPLEEPSPVYLVSLVGLVYLVCLVQPNTRDRPNRPDRPDEQDRLADFFSILF